MTVYHYNGFKIEVRKLPKFYSATIVLDNKFRRTKLEDLERSLGPWIHELNVLCLKLNKEYPNGKK